MGEEDTFVPKVNRAINRPAMFLGRQPSHFETLFSEEVGRVRGLLDQMGIEYPIFHVHNWAPEGLYAILGKPFKTLVKRNEKKAGVTLRKMYPDASAADLQALPLFCGIEMSLQEWVSTHPADFPNASVKG